MSEEVGEDNFTEPEDDQLEDLSFDSYSENDETMDNLEGGFVDE